MASKENDPKALTSRDCIKKASESKFRERLGILVQTWFFQQANRLLRKIK
jgi:hypothetical protein